MVVIFVVFVVDGDGGGMVGWFGGWSVDILRI